MGFAAVDSGSGELIGAAWLRLLAADEKGYGYVDEETPELGIAVLPEHRGRGVGAALLEWLLQAAGVVYEAVSLSVSADSPAVRLYERTGFRQVGIRGTSVTMMKNLRA